MGVITETMTELSFLERFVGMPYQADITRPKPPAAIVRAVSQKRRIAAGCKLLT